MTYRLVCGCTVAHVHTTEKGKSAPGDYWYCQAHGNQEIEHAEGHGA